MELQNHEVNPIDLSMLFIVNPYVPCRVEEV